MRSPWQGDGRPGDSGSQGDSGQGDAARPIAGASQAGPIPRRGTDRVERASGLVLRVLAVVLLVGAVLTAISLRGDGLAQAAREATEKHQVTATLVEAAQMPIALDPSSSASGTLATWTGPDGSAHRESVVVIGPRPAGSTVPIWVDRAGTPSPPPVDVVQASVTAAMSGLLMLVVGGLVLYVVRAGVRARCAVVNHRRWAREWSLYEPLWSGR